MPKTRGQKIVFSVLMALIMVYGMEVYNHIIGGARSFAAFSLPVAELLGLMSAVVVLQETIGGRLARFAAFKIVNPKTDARLKVIVTIQIFTVCVMCPLMSCLATVVFKSDVDAPFLVKWGLTLAVNLPFAFVWQLLVAGPIVRKVVKC